MAQALEVVSQEVHATVDIANKSIAGWTELQLIVPVGATSVGLHAFGLQVTSVQVDGRPAPFSAAPRQPPPLPEQAPAGAGAASPDELVAAIAEAAAQQYERVLQWEHVPELEVTLPAGRTAARPAEAEAGAEGEGGAEAAGQAEAVGASVRVRVEYSASSPLCGVHFWGRFAATDAQVRRASAWLPCLDVPQASVTFALHLTVRADETAVGPGQLVKQTWADAARRWRTFHYAVALPCAPAELGFAAGPFEVVAGSVPPPAQGGPPTVLTSFAPAARSGGAGGGAGGGGGGDLAHTATFAALPMALYQSGDVLAARFPLPALQQVFLPPELARGRVHTGVGLQMLSAQALVAPRSVEQSQEARCAIAAALARQWFGHLIRPATAEDSWLVEGLAGWLEEQYVRRYQGKTELAYRRWRQREVIAAADQGDAPPLAARAALSLSPWGAMFGTERLDPSPLRALKATAVVGMLERRAGEDLFRKHLEAVVVAAAAAGAAPAASAVAAAAGTPGQLARDPRQLEALTFINELGRAGDFKKEVGAFMERWVYGRGVPRIDAAFEFNRRRSVLEIVMHQSGGEAAKRGADAAEAAAQREGQGTGVIRVVVREGSGATVDHPVHAGGLPMLVAQVKVNPEVKKVPGKRGRKRKEEEEIMAAKAAAAQNAQHPVQWVRLDPHGEWLCSIRLRQPERMLLNQLHDSRDVVAQAEAVRELSRQPVSAHSAGPLRALREVLEDPHMHCRVRMDAAMALAELRGENREAVGLPLLLAYYRERFWESDPEDPDAEPAVRPVSFADVSEYLVAQAVVTAVAACRGPDADAEFDRIFFLLQSCNHYISAWGPYDDSGMLAALCHALGEIRVATSEDAAGVYGAAFQALERHLNKDAVAPSPGCLVGRACLSAMASLAGSVHCPSWLVQDALVVVSKCCAERTCPLEMREAAQCALLQVTLSRRGLGAALRHALSVCAEGGDAAVVPAVWEEVVAQVAVGGAARGDLTADVLRGTASLLNASHDTRLRHLAFVALRRMQRKPPNLYVPPPAEAYYGLGDHGEGTDVSAAAGPSRVVLKLSGARAAATSEGGTAAVTVTALSGGGGLGQAAGEVDQQPIQVEAVDEGALPVVGASPAAASPAAAPSAASPVVGAGAPAAPATSPPKFKFKVKLVQ